MKNLVLRRTIASVVLIAVLLGGGIATARWLHATRPQAERTATPSPPPLVHVAVLDRRDIQEYFVGYGSARADRDVVIAAEVSGVIVDVAPGLNDGVHVDADQPLVRIDDRQYRQVLIRTEATASDLSARIGQLDVEKDNVERLARIAADELSVNQDEFERLSGLFEKDLASQKEYDFARLAVQKSRRQHQGLRNQINLIQPRRRALQAQHAARSADAELARLDIARCDIAAPFQGTIAELTVNVGDHVLPGSGIVRLMSTRRIEVPVELPASVRREVEVGAACTLEADAMPDLHWSGAVARIAPAADARSRTFSAYVEVDNDAQETPLVPGYFLKATVAGPMWRQVLAVPRGAIVSGRVFVVNGHAAHARSVRIERYLEELAVVSGSLAAGDRVILTNLDKLEDGHPVRVSTDSVNDPAGVPVIAGGIP